MFFPRFPWQRWLRRRAGLSRARRPRRRQGRRLWGQNGREVRAALPLPGSGIDGDCGKSLVYVCKYNCHENIHYRQECPERATQSVEFCECFWMRLSVNTDVRNVWLKGLFVICFIYDLLRTFSFPFQKWFQKWSTQQTILKTTVNVLFVFLMRLIVKLPAASPMASFDSGIEWN